jgi:protein involved in sex pheromone biosynthesis
MKTFFDFLEEVTSEHRPLNQDSPSAIDMCEEAAKRYAKQCAQDALNRAAENARIMSIPHYGDVYREVDRDSIKNTQIITP